MQKCAVKGRQAPCGVWGGATRSCRRARPLRPEAFYYSIYLLSFCSMFARQERSRKPFPLRLTAAHSPPKEKLFLSRYMGGHIKPFLLNLPAAYRPLFDLRSKALSTAAQLCPVLYCDLGARFCLAPLLSAPPFKVKVKVASGGLGRCPKNLPEEQAPLDSSHRAGLLALRFGFAARDRGPLDISVFPCYPMKIRTPRSSAGGGSRRQAEDRNRRLKPCFQPAPPGACENPWRSRRRVDGVPPAGPLGPRPRPAQPPSPPARGGGRGRRPATGYAPGRLRGGQRGPSRKTCPEGRRNAAGAQRTRQERENRAL